MPSDRQTAEALRAELKAMFSPEPDSADGERVDGGKPVGMEPAAWEGCECPTCRAQRREHLGSEAADRDQQTLGGWSDE